MASAIAGFTPTQTATTSTSSALNGMTSGDFLNLMIQQLQQQDPLNPTDSNQLLTQMSQISTLQSNTQMQTSLQGLTLQQSIGAGGNLIGKTISGIDPNGNHLQGVVTGVTVANQQISLSLDSGSSLPLANVTQISNGVPTTPQTPTTPTTPTNSPQLQDVLTQLLSFLRGAQTTPASGNVPVTTPSTSVPMIFGPIAPLAGASQL